MSANSSLNVVFVTAEVAKLGNVLQSKFSGSSVWSKLIRRAEPAIPSPVARSTVTAFAAAPKPTSQITNSAECAAQPFGKRKLPNIQRLRFRDRPDHRMKRLALRQRMNAISALASLTIL